MLSDEDDTILEGCLLRGGIMGVRPPLVLEAGVGLLTPVLTRSELERSSPLS